MPAVIEHLKSIGVTAVELLPCQAFVSEQFLVERNLTNYWGYNPLAWFAAGQLARERELSCDDEVLNMGTDRTDYAEQLLAILRTLRDPSTLQAPVTGMAHAFEGRLAGILDPPDILAEIGDGDEVHLAVAVNVEGQGGEAVAVRPADWLELAHGVRRPVRGVVPGVADRERRADEAVLDGTGQPSRAVADPALVHRDVAAAGADRQPPVLDGEGGADGGVGGGG